jgi:hypothetical protein
MSIPEEVQRARDAVDQDGLDYLLSEAHDFRFNVPEGEAIAVSILKAARALTGEYEIDVLRRTAREISTRRICDATFTVYDAMNWIQHRADELEASMKGGDDG